MRKFGHPFFSTLLVLSSFHKMHNMGGRAASLAVLAVFTAIYQRSKSPPPRNSSAADLENSQIPAVRSLFFTLFVAQWNDRKMLLP